MYPSNSRLKLLDPQQGLAEATDVYDFIVTKDMIANLEVTPERIHADKNIYTCMVMTPMKGYP